jgi:hypothetical protein
MDPIMILLVELEEGLLPQIYLSLLHRYPTMEY